jgi:hypothetical protein
MESSNQKSTETLIKETWATLDRIAKSHEEFREDLKKSREEFDKRMEEFDLSMKKSREEFDLSMKKSREEFDLSMKKSREEFDHRIEKINGTMGSWRNSFGSFAEEYFMNSFERGEKNFFGEHFDEIEKNMKYKKSKGEYDIVLINKTCIGIIEVKFRGRFEDIEKILEKPNSFRDDFPEYKEHKIYLGLAGMSFDSKVEEEYKKEGIAMIKQVGDNVIIIDGHLKAF